jgi:uncharacterized membrane protein YbhN (UPF0104 family)
VLAGFCLRGLRWRLLFRNHQVRTWRLVLVENTAVGVNSISPIPILDEPTRVGLMMLQGVPAGTVLATMAAMRTFELTAQATVGVVGIIELPPLRVFSPYILAATGVAALALVALFTIGPLLRRLPFLQRLGLAQDFSSGVEVMKRAPLQTLASMGLSLGYVIVIGLGGWMLGGALDIHLGVLAMVILSLAVIFFTDWVPGLPGAVGTFEFVALYVLGLWGVDRTQAFSYAILLHVMFFVPPLLIAAVYLPYAGFRSVAAVLRLFRGERSGEAAHATGGAGGEGRVQGNSAPGFSRKE